MMAQYTNWINEILNSNLRGDFMDGFGGGGSSRATTTTRFLRKKKTIDKERDGHTKKKEKRKKRQPIPKGHVWSFYQFQKSYVRQRFCGFISFLFIFLVFSF